MMRGGRGVASTSPSGDGATLAADRAPCLRSMIFFLSLSACFSIFAIARDRKSTRLNSSHTEICTLSLPDALPISIRRRRHARRGSRALFAIDDLLLEFERLLFNLRHRPRQRHVHVRVGIGGGQRVVAPVDDDLADLAVHLDVDDYVSARS